jgi:hypothetical protein
MLTVEDHPLSADERQVPTTSRIRALIAEVHHHMRLRRSAIALTALLVVGLAIGVYWIAAGTPLLPSITSNPYIEVEHPASLSSVEASWTVVSSFPGTGAEGFGGQIVATTLKGPLEMITRYPSWPSFDASHAFEGPAHAYFTTNGRTTVYEQLPPCAAPQGCSSQQLNWQASFVSAAARPPTAPYSPTTVLATIRRISDGRSAFEGRQSLSGVEVRKYRIPIDAAKWSLLPSGKAGMQPLQSHADEVSPPRFLTVWIDAQGLLRQFLFTAPARLGSSGPPDGTEEVQAEFSHFDQPPKVVPPPAKHVEFIDSARGAEIFRP